MSGYENLIAAAKAGRLTRRSFLEGAASLGIASSLALPTWETAHAAQPQKGGHFRIGSAQGQTTDTLDPGTFTGSMRLLAGSVCNYLAEVNAKGEVIPELAEAIEPNAQYDQFIVKLKKTIEFHNGKTLSAADVIASYNHHRSQTSTSKMRDALSEIVDIRSDDANTVVFHLRGANIDFPSVLADNHLPIYASADEKIDTNKMIGTGAYRLSDWDPGVRATMERQANYWKEGHGNFNSAEVIVVKDAVARTNALITGEVDAIDECDLNTIHLLKRNADVNIIQTPSTMYYDMLMFTNVAPFDSNDVRLAIKYAVDREAIVKNVLKGYGKVGNDNPLTPVSKFYNDQLPQREYDPDKAKFHLKKAGVSALDLSLSTSNVAFGGAMNAAAIFQERAKLAGLNVSIKREPDDGYWSNVWRKVPFMMGQLGGRLTADALFTVLFSFNETHFHTDRHMQILKAARGERDEELRREMYFELQQIVHDEGGILVHSLPNLVYAARKNVKHGALAVTWSMDSCRAIDRWWFDS